MMTNLFMKLKKNIIYLVYKALGIDGLNSIIIFHKDHNCCVDGITIIHNKPYVVIMGNLDNALIYPLGPSSKPINVMSTKNKPIEARWFRHGHVIGDY